MPINTKFLLTVSIVVAVANFPCMPRAETISIQGKVLFADGSIPDAAHVTVASGTTFKVVESDATGNYVIADLPFGTYNLAAFGTFQDRAGSFRQTGVVIASDTALPLIVNITLTQATPNQ